MSNSKEGSSSKIKRLKQLSKKKMFILVISTAAIVTLLLSSTFLPRVSAQSIEDYVDAQSDVDGSPDVGTHSNFDDMKSVDGNNDTLTEYGVAGGKWGIDDDTGSDGTSTHATYRYMGGVWDKGDANITHLSIHCGTTGTVAIGLYTGGTLSNPVGATRRTSVYNQAVSAGWNTFDCTDYEITNGSITWIGWGHSASVTYHSGSNPAGSDFQDAEGRWNQNSPADADETSEMNATISAGSFGAYWYCVYANYTKPPDYHLDLEVQFTAVIWFLDGTESLCILTGDFVGTEDLNVTYWDGDSWELIASDLNELSWNNFTVSLTSDTYTIKFAGSTTVGDTFQDSWEIDAALLKVSGSGCNNYPVDNEDSDVDTSDDIGTLSNFGYMKAYNSSYATLTEATVGGAISYVDSTEAVSTGDLVISVPSVLDGDFMITIVAHADDDPAVTLTPASGWTLQRGKTDMGTRAISPPVCWIYYRVASSEPASYTWQFSTAGGRIGFCLAYRNVDGIYIDSLNAQTGTGGTAISPSVVTTTDGDWIISYAWHDDDDPPDMTPPPDAGFNARHDAQTSSGGNGMGMGVGDEERASAGATGTRTWTLTGTEERSAIMLAINQTAADGDYKLEHEVQFVNVPHQLDNETICIYMNSTDAEDLVFQIWTDASAWANVTTDLLPNQWNNYTISFNSTTVTFRFRDGTQTGDSTTQDSWQVNAAIIRVCHEVEVGVEYERAATLGLSIGFTTTRELDAQRSGTLDLSIGFTTVALAEYFRSVTLALTFVFAVVAIFLVERAASLGLTFGFSTDAWAAFGRAASQSLAFTWDADRQTELSKTASLTLTLSLLATALSEFIRSVTLTLTTAFSAAVESAFGRAGSLTLSYSSQVSRLLEAARSGSLSLTVAFAVSILSEFVRSVTLALTTAFSALAESAFGKVVSLALSFSSQAARILEAARSASQAISFSSAAATLIEVGKAASLSITVTFQTVASTIAEYLRSVTLSLTTSFQTSTTKEILKDVTLAITIGFTTVAYVLAEYFVGAALTITILVHAFWAEPARAVGSYLLIGSMFGAVFTMVAGLLLLKKRRQNSE